MKRRHLMGFALCLLLFSGSLWFFRKPATVRPVRYQHEHLQSPALEPRAKLLTADYKLPGGETLSGVATQRYGHRNYHSVIELYNHLENEAQIAADTSLRLPDISVILAEEGVTKVVPREVEMILCSRARYDRIVDQLWALHSKSTGNFVVPENVKRELLEAADDLQQATEGLKMTRSGASAAPVSMIGQLEQNTAAIKLLATGAHDSNGYDIDMVQQRYALALTYAIIWARDGFK